MIVYSPYGGAHSEAKLGTLQLLQTHMLPHLTNRLLSSRMEAQLPCLLIFYLPFRLMRIGTVDDSLKSFQTYAHWLSRAHGVQRQARMFAVASVQRLLQHTAHVVRLVR